MAGLAVSANQINLREYTVTMSTVTVEGDDVSTALLLTHLSGDYPSNEAQEGNAILSL